MEITGKDMGYGMKATTGQPPEVGARETTVSEASIKGEEHLRYSVLR